MIQKSLISPTDKDFKVDPPTPFSSETETESQSVHSNPKIEPTALHLQVARTNSGTFWQYDAEWFKNHI